MMQSPGKTSDSSKNLPNITLSSTRVPTKRTVDQSCPENKNANQLSSPELPKQTSLNSPFLLEDQCHMSLFEQNESSVQMQEILRKFLKSHSVIDTFPLNQRVSIYNQDINLLDFVKFYVENPIEHPSANCTACLIYDSTSKIYIGALTLQDVSNMIIYFKDASKKFDPRLQVTEEDHLFEENKKKQLNYFSLYKQSRKEAQLQIQKLKEKSSPEECKRIISALIFNLTNQHLNISDVYKAEDTMLYLQLKSVTLRDWVVFLHDEDSIEQSRCKLVTMEADTSLYEASLELDRLCARELVIQDHNTDIIGILNRRNIINLIRRYLRLDGQKAALFKQPILKMNFQVSSPTKRSPVSSPRVSRRNSQQYLSLGEELGLLSVNEDESLFQALKLMIQYNLEFISVVEQSKAIGTSEIKGLLFTTDIIYILRKKNYLQILDYNVGMIVKQLNCLNHIHLPLLDYLPHPPQEQEAERNAEQIFDDVQDQLTSRSMANSRRFSMADSDGVYQNEEFKTQISELGVSLAAGLGSYEVSNQGGTLGLNSTTATSRRNREQGQAEEDKKQRVIPGFFRVRKLEGNDSLVDVVGKIFQSEEKILVGLSETGRIKTSVSLSDLFDYMVRSASQFDE